MAMDIKELKGQAFDLMRMIEIRQMEIQKLTQQVNQISNQISNEERNIQKSELPDEVKPSKKTK